MLSVEGILQGEFANDCYGALQEAADILKFVANEVFLTGGVVLPGALKA